MSDKPFRYRLQPLIGLRSAERDALQGDMRRAAAEVEKRGGELEQLSREIVAAEGRLRGLLADGASIAVDEQLRLQGYLDSCRKRREAKRRELDEASQALHRVLEQLLAKQREAKTLEKHRERQRRDFDQAQARLAHRAADELWLRRKRED